MYRYLIILFLGLSLGLHAQDKVEHTFMVPAFTEFQVIPKNTNVGVVIGGDNPEMTTQVYLKLKEIIYGNEVFDLLPADQQAQLDELFKANTSEMSYTFEGLTLAKEITKSGFILFGKVNTEDYSEADQSLSVPGLKKKELASMSRKKMQLNLGVDFELIDLSNMAIVGFFNLGDKARKSLDNTINGEQLAGNETEKETHLKALRGMAAKGIAKQVIKKIELREKSVTFMYDAKTKKILERAIRYCQVERFTGAKEFIETELKKSSFPEASEALLYYNIGVIDLCLGKPKDAKFNFEEAFIIHPKKLYKEYFEKAKKFISLQKTVGLE